MIRIVANGFQPGSDMRNDIAKIFHFLKCQLNNFKFREEWTIL